MENTNTKMEIQNAIRENVREHKLNNNNSKFIHSHVRCIPNRVNFHTLLHVYVENEGNKIQSQKSGVKTINV